MASDDLVERILVRLESDQQAANKTKADIAAHQQSLQQLEQRQESLTQAENQARTAEERLARARQSGQSETRDSSEEVELLTRRLREQEEASGRAAAAEQRRSQSEGGRGRLESIDRTGAIGSQIAGALGSSEIGNITGFIGDIAGSFSSLGVAGIATAGAVGLVTLGLNEFNKGLEASQSLLKTTLDAQTVYYTAVQELSSQQAQEEIARRERDNARLQQQISETENAIEHAFAYAAQQLGDAGARAADAAGVLPTAQLREHLNGLKAEFGLNEQAVARLTQGLEANAFAANDAAEAAEAATARQRERDQRWLAGEQAYLAADKLTAEQRQNRIDDIQREIDSYQFLIDTGELTAETTNELIDRIRNLNIEQTAYKNTVESTADRLAAATAATERLKEGTDQVLDATTRYTEARQAAFEAEQRYTEGLEQQQRNIDRINADLQEKERALDAQAASAQIERERKLGLDRAKVAEEMQERILAAEERAGRSFSNARARRDVLAAIAADQQRKDEQTQAAKDAQRRLDDLKDNAAEQERVERQRLEESQQTQRAAAQRAIQLENEKARAELATRARAAQAAAAQVTNTEQNLLNIQRYYNGLVEQEAYRAGAAQVAAYQAGLGTRYTGSAAGGTPYPTTKVVNPGATKQASITIQGTSQASIERQVVKTLRKVYA